MKKIKHELDCDTLSEDLKSNFLIRAALFQVYDAIKGFNVYEINSQFVNNLNETEISNEVKKELIISLTNYIEDEFKTIRQSNCFLNAIMNGDYNEDSIPQT
tara:strand:+ start:2525 stop:2830 length:306 start_codon:yes stop_codon:yes gene_type:complete